MGEDAAGGGVVAEHERADESETSGDRGVRCIRRGERGTGFFGVGGQVCCYGAGVSGYRPALCLLVRVQGINDKYSRIRYI